MTEILEKPKFPVTDESKKFKNLITPHSFKFFSILYVGSVKLAAESGIDLSKDNSIRSL